MCNFQTFFFEIGIYLRAMQVCIFTWTILKSHRIPESIAQLNPESIHDLEWILGMQFHFMIGPLVLLK